MPDLAPPPYNTQSTGTFLIFDSDDFTDNRFWHSDADRNHPMFTIRSTNHGKHRILCSGRGEAVIGQVVFHGATRYGYGTVSIAGAKPIAIEDWMRGGRDVRICGNWYQWSHFSIKRGNSTQTIFEVQFSAGIIYKFTSSDISISRHDSITKQSPCIQGHVNVDPDSA
jgi:hypothetical protein